LQRKLNVDSLAQVLEIAWRQGLLGGMEPVAERADAEQPAQERFQQIFDAMPMPVALRDTEGRLLACNQQYLTFHAVTQEQALGMRIIDSSVLTPEEALRMHQNYLQAVTLAQPFRDELILRYRDRQMAVRSWGVPFHDSQGSLVGMLCSTVDITDHEQQIASLSQTREQRRSITRTRTLFLQDAAEQLMTQLDGIIKSVHRVSHQQPDNQRLGSIQSGLLTVQEQIQVLLDVVRIERGIVVLIPVKAELNQLTRDEVAAFNGRHPATPSTVALQTEAHPANVWVDPARYRQMVRSILEYCLSLGLPDIVVQCQATPAPQAELDWQLHIKPGPTSLAEGLADYLTQNEINPQLALGSRLMALMNGELSLEPPGADGPLAILCIRFPQAA